MTSNTKCYQYRRGKVAIVSFVGRPHAFLKKYVTRNASSYLMPNIRNTHRTCDIENILFDRIYE